MNRPLFPESIERSAKSPSTTSLAETVGSVDSSFVLGPYHRPNEATVMLPGNSTGEAVCVRPSLRSYRRNFTIACTAFTLGSLLIVFSSPWSREFIAPGPLSSHHAPLAANENGDRCAACHAAANGSLASWISGFFSAEKNQGLSQSELCMQCHENSISGPFALNPHNVDPSGLAEVTQRITSGTKTVGAGHEFTAAQSSNPEIACSTCHQEHHGGVQLTTLTDAQCQSCHAQKFASFDSGHPEFSQYPQQRRSRIAFDHASHFGKHFPEKGASFDCAQCHVDDAYQNVKRLAPFEQSCAKCHGQQILDSVSEGLVLVSLPMLDMTAIEQAGLDVGSWPLAATGDFDGVISPWMRVLLFADSEANEILVTRGSKFEFFDFDADNPQDVADAVKLAWAIKRLIAGLAKNGSQELTQRFERVLGMKVPNSELNLLLTTMDDSVFRLMQQAWLPNLATELNQAVSQSEQQRMESESSINVVIDAFLARESQFAPGLSTLSKSEPKNEQASGPNRSPFLLVSQQFGKPLADDDWLAVNPLAGLMKNGDKPRALSEKSTEPSQRENESAPVAQPAVAPSAELEPLVQALLQSPDSLISSNRASGWYRDDKKLQISYQATGHADPCLKSWIELAARIPTLDKRPELEPVMTKILSATGIGQCQSCHTVDRRLAEPISNDGLAVNWMAEYRDPARQGFTKFSHAPHLVHSELKDCSNCHQLDPNRTNSHSFASFDSQEVISNFRPIVKSDCLQCHQQGRTNSSCMTCHHYHVDASR